MALRHLVELIAVGVAGAMGKKVTDIPELEKILSQIDQPGVGWKEAFTAVTGEDPEEAYRSLRLVKNPIMKDFLEGFADGRTEETYGVQVERDDSEDHVEYRRPHIKGPEVVSHPLDATLGFATLRETDLGYNIPRDYSRQLRDLLKERGDER